MEELYALLHRVFVVVLGDGDIASTHTNHAVSTDSGNLLGFATKEVRILLLKLDDRHEATNKLT